MTPILPKRFVRNSLLGVLLSGAFLAPFASGQSSNSNEGFFYCKSRDFNIPFNIASVGRSPVELELEISSDGGSNWLPVQRTKPTAKSFRFQASNDGLYLFRLKTIDANGQANPTSDLPLQVVVDSQKPTADLRVDIDAQGMYVANFMIVEPHLDLESVRIQYRTERQDAWVDVPSSLGRGNDAYEVQGKARWEVPLGIHQLVVRLIAKDQAENEIEVFRYPEMPKTAQAPSSLQLASQRGAASGGPAVRIASRGPASNLMASQEKTTEAEPILLPKAIPSQGSSQGAGQNSFQPSGIGSDGKFVLKNLDSEEISNPSSLNSNSGNDDRFTLEQEGGLALDPSTTIYPFYSLSKTFSLDYDLQAHPAIGIQAVELWGTTDGGKSWENWGSDADRASPMEVAVEEEGLFGFRIVVVSGNGVITNRPMAGDVADIWVQVDTEVPTARITSAQYGRGAELGSLVIEYDASDAHLSERPITLTFSESPNGPWVTVATGVKNTGKFAWPADPSLPRRVYLRLEAMDQAGNIGEFKLPMPVDIEGLSPRGRIQGIRPVRK